MEVRYFKGYSYNLNREMEFKVYGHRGKPVLFIPCQAGRFYDFENFHMDDVFRPYIDAGEIMVFSIDTLDNETWADHGGNPRARIEQHERWFNYIVDEMVPQIRHLAGERNWCQMPIMPFGASSNSRSFSCAACGAWSVTMMSTVPSRTPSITASLSWGVRSGGFTFKFVL